MRLAYACTHHTHTHTHTHFLAYKMNRFAVFQTAIAKCEMEKMLCQKTVCHCLCLSAGIILILDRTQQLYADSSQSLFDDSFLSPFQASHCVFQPRAHYNGRFYDHKKRKNFWSLFLHTAEHHTKAGVTDSYTMVKAIRHKKKQYSA
jgi:hypothetical protein